jgi:hypothetical protein
MALEFETMPGLKPWSAICILQWHVYLYVPWVAQHAENSSFIREATDSTGELL